MFRKLRKALGEFIDELVLQAYQINLLDGSGACEW